MGFYRKYNQINKRKNSQVKGNIQPKLKFSTLLSLD